MADIFIVTEEGRSYSSEGIRHVTECLSEIYGISEKVTDHTYNMGQFLNDTGTLIDLIGKSGDPYVVGSLQDGIIYLGGEYLTGFIEECGETPELSSYEIILGIHEQLEQNSTEEK